jgi:hypothetical protein
MKPTVIALLLAVFAAGPAYAKTCATKAVSKDGKLLAGAAKASFIKICCKDSAVSKDGKPRSGAAAKNSYGIRCLSG